MKTLVKGWKAQAAKLKTETYALYLAYRDPRIPLHARIFAALVVGYAFSPIDLIPDFIPVLGYLDDLILIPLGVKIALTMIPAEVMDESRAAAKALMSEGKPVNRTTAVVIVAIWILLAGLSIMFILRLVKN